MRFLEMAKCHENVDVVGAHDRAYTVLLTTQLLAFFAFGSPKFCFLWQSQEYSICQSS
jgi:hypothetical protein